MNRRTLLRASGAATVTTLTGCLADGGSPGSGGDGADDDGTDGDDGADEDGADDGGTADDAPYSIELDTAVSGGEGTVDLSFDLVDDEVTADSPAEIEIELANGTDGPIEISSGAPAPFGVIWLTRTEDHETDGRNDSITLWTDAYAESSHVGTDGKAVTEVQDIGLVEELDAGETVARRYELHAETPNLRAGTYTGTVRFGVQSEDRSGGVSADLTVDVEASAGSDDSTEEVEYAVVGGEPALTDDARRAIDSSEHVTALIFDTESEARDSLALDDPEIEAIVDETEFSTAALVYVRTTAPQTCYRASVRSLYWSGDTLGGRVAVERTAPENQPCGDAITHPAVLVRVRTDGRTIAGDDIGVVEE